MGKFSPNRDAGVVRRNVCPDTRRRYPGSDWPLYYKEEVRLYNKRIRAESHRRIYEEEVS